MGLIYLKPKENQLAKGKKPVKKIKLVKKTKPKTHRIDCDAAPFCPAGWTIDTHIKGGIITFQKNPFTLYIADEQKSGFIEGVDLQKNLLEMKIANANILDYFHKNQKIIPSTWRGTYLGFWGTIYKDIEGLSCIRCLYHNGSGWHFAYSRIKGNYWDDNDQAVVLRSQKKR